MSRWQQTTLNEIAEVNPKEKLSKGSVANKIGMENLFPFCKKVSGKSLEPFNGGTKFRNGDILIARITPCLENGKTAYVDVLNNDEVGFGSTEYIVLREKPKKSYSQYLYYFVRSDFFRSVAIASMTGSSGRQRVQTDVVQNYIFEFPDYEEQKAIASVLSSLDDKIDLLHRQNKTLESMAETLFRQWFVEDIQDSQDVPLKELVDVIDNRGKTPPYIVESTAYPIIEVNTLTHDGRNIDYSLIRKYVNEQTFNTWFRKHLKKFDVLVSTVGSIGAFAMFFGGTACVAQNVIGLRAKDKISNYYLYQWLLFHSNEIKELDIGSVQPSIKVPHLLSLPMKIPNKEKIIEFDYQSKTIVQKILNNSNAIAHLEKLRDTLLPKLMSGEVRVQYTNE